MSEHLKTAWSMESTRRVVKLQGELDIATAQRAADALAEDFDVLDLSELEFLDSTGMQVLMQACQSHSKPAVIRGLKGQVRRVLELTRLLDIFIIEDAESSNPPASLA